MIFNFIQISSLQNCRQSQEYKFYHELMQQWILCIIRIIWFMWEYVKFSIWKVVIKINLKLLVLVVYTTNTFYIFKFMYICMYVYKYSICMNADNIVILYLFILHYHTREKSSVWKFKIAFSFKNTVVSSKGEW